jgi:hypothetical protein
MSPGRGKCREVPDLAYKIKIPIPEIGKIYTLANRETGIDENVMKPYFKNIGPGSKIKEIEMTVINTFQLAARKNAIQMSSDVITTVTVIINY